MEGRTRSTQKGGRWLNNGCSIGCMTVLKEAFDAIEKMPVFRSEPGDYAKLADEEDENGPVHLYRKNGTLVMQMPREVWDSLRKESQT